MFPYVWLSLALLWLWLPPQRAATRPLARLGVSAGWLTLATGHGYIDGLLAPIALAGIVAFGFLAWGYAVTTAPPASMRSSSAHAIPTSSTQRVLALVAVITFGLALMAHVVPGFSNLLIVRDAVLSADAVPYTLYFNFDKTLIGLFLLAGMPLIASPAGWTAMLAATLPRLLAIVVVVMVCAMALGQVRLDLKWPAILPYWVWANLLFTCAAEEALFRGVIQRQLQGEKGMTAGATGAWSTRAATGLAIAGVLFGVAHYAGGVRTIVLATIAGAGYGWVFWRTGRIEASILAHFLLNTVHILGFTYPALR